MGKSKAELGARTQCALQSKHHVTHVGNHVLEPISSTDALTLLNLHPNVEHLSVVELPNNTRINEVQTPAFILNTLHIGDSRGEVINTDDLIDILRHCPEVRKIGLLKAEAPALEAIMTYCNNIEVVKALYDPFHIERFSQRRPVMDTVNDFCLETFRCRIVRFARLNEEQQASSLRSRVSSEIWASITVTQLYIKPSFTSSYDPEYPNSYSFRGRSKFYEYGEPIADTMKLSRDSGLERLAGLKYLEIFGFEGTDHRVGKQELEWMADQWPNLRVMRGLAKDNLLYLKYDTKKAALHEYMMSLGGRSLGKVQLDLSLQQCSEHILGADKNAMADLLDLDFGSSSEPAYSTPPASSPS
ncbi:hypothetical protein BGZ75_010220 [Mortierella antarctica]|nr:hypothetical protein BGZ75_010220 [Mortierella antarctica]